MKKLLVGGFAAAVEDVDDDGGADEGGDAGVLAAKPGNERFDLVDIYCYSEEKPEYSGYWHFVNGMPELWVVE